MTWRVPYSVVKSSSPAPVRGLTRVKLPACSGRPASSSLSRPTPLKLEGRARLSMMLNTGVSTWKRPALSSVLETRRRRLAMPIFDHSSTASPSLLARVRLPPPAITPLPRSRLMALKPATSRPKPTGPWV
ncbi:hypothetical protein D3C84_911980 [compost metagenome]